MHESPLGIVAQLLLELAVILIFAKIGGEVFERYLKIPAVLGELIAGIIISPFALGGVDFGFFGPLFSVPLESDGHGGLIPSTLPVEPQIFFVAQLAAVILLFEAGLETNRAQFLKWARPASAVATGGVLLPFVLGFFATIMFGFASFGTFHDMAPALFIGAIMTATSVGITARVLADIRRLDSPEGVTVLAAAVIDDVLGIIVLAVVIGVVQGGDVTAGSVALIFVKAVGFWLGLTIIGSMVSKYISRGILWFRGAGAHVALTLALAFLAAGIAELGFGLAMIIGSYSLGLALSDTELKHQIESGMRQINNFLVPIFFCVIGMQADLSAFGGEGVSKSLAQAIAFAVVLSLLAIVSKLAGAGLPAMLVGFNKRGAWRVGVGMLPRGEVALIVAGIGLTSGVIERDEFGVAIVMTVVTTVLAPILLIPAFRGGSGLRKKLPGATPEPAPASKNPTTPVAEQSATESSDTH
ncbi:MAG: cation:proton antiporter [Chloroflexi bacterium]|nr:cation:proton antiporter [Chloroflexota bacterium]